MVVVAAHQREARAVGSDHQAAFAGGKDFLMIETENPGIAGCAGSSFVDVARSETLAAVLDHETGPVGDRSHHAVHMRDNDPLRIVGQFVDIEVKSLVNVAKD